MRHLLLALACLPLILGQDPIAKPGTSPSQAGVDPEARARAVELGLAYVAAGRPAARDGELSTSLTEAEEEAALARRLRIEQELARNPTHPWAGIYSHGDGLGMNVSLWVAPESGAVYTWRGCLGLYDVNHGAIEGASADALQIRLAVDPAHNQYLHEAGLPRPFMSDRWLFVRLGDEAYLIPAVQMIPFCNAVNNRDGYSLRKFPRRGAGTSPGPNIALPPDLPAVPAPYDQFLLRSPVTGLVSAVADPVQIGTYVGGGPTKVQLSATLDAGLQAGILPGMLFYTLTERSLEGEVVAVADDECTVEFRYPEGHPHVPQRGARLTTCAP